MNKQGHVKNLMTDYILGLLPDKQAIYLKTHIAECSLCRRELWIERQIGAEIRSTLAAISIPDEHQLDKLMPPAPQLKSGWRQARHLKAGLAIASALVIISLTTIGLQAGFGQNSWLYPSPTAYSTTTLVTDTPTNALIATPSSEVPYGSTAHTPEALQHRVSPHPAVIPVPAATFLN